MSDDTITPETGRETLNEGSAPPVTAGQMLKAARESAGMHIAALSVALKVPVRKLESLEADAHDQLPGSTFTRALAQSVCRALKMDAAPVLALLPDRQSAGLDHAVIGGARRDAFAASPAPAQPQRTGSALPRPVLLAAAALLLVAAALLLLPPLSTWSPEALLGMRSDSPQSAASPARQAESSAPKPNQLPAEPVKATSAEAVPSPVQTDLAGPRGAPGTELNMPAPTSTAGGGLPARSGAAALTSSSDGNAPLQLKATAPSWVEVRDSAGAVVYTGTVVPGMPVGVELKVNGQLVVGNAASTEVTWRGRQLDIAAAARDNVARVELR
jgi:cytoskeleton protein RodZ